ncbi:MAG: signal peptide peptidase SppA [Bacteroidales bacterium]
MKQFFKITFACVLGVMIAGFIGSVLLFFGIISMATVSSPQYKPSSNTVFKLKLNTSVVERASVNPLEEIMNIYSDDASPIGLDVILQSIEKAKKDDHVIGIYLNTDGYSAAYATTEAIRRKLDEFKESGKFIVAYNDAYSQNQYYLSSVADSIYLNPVGSLNFSGLASQHIFFKNALDKLGVQMQVFRVGTFKSAVEPFIVDKMSQANREQTEVYLNSIWDTLLSDISKTRQLSVDSLDSIANLGIGFHYGEIATQKGLVTALKYKSEILPLLKKMASTEDISTADLSEIHSMKSKEKDHSDKIAILYAVGEIAGGPTKDGIYWENTISEIEKIKEDDDVKALVFRVNSPGGSAFASEQIWEAIQSLKEKKPVVVSMGDYAASGGYYISCNADYIIAEPATITGSIGVFGLIPNANDLFEDKIGLSFDEVKTNTFGNITLFTPMTEQEKALTQKSVEDVYALFMKRCAEGRKLPVDSIAKIAEGRVWTGSNALQLGLVDELGGMSLAINKAAELANLKKFSTEAYPRSKDFFETLVDEFKNDASLHLQKQILGEEFKNVQLVKYIRSLDRIQARMDYMIIK